MRFFKHGDSLAVVLPDKLRKSSSVSENDEYEFFELAPGLFTLVEKRQLEARVKKTVLAELVARLSQPGVETVPAGPSAPSQSGSYSSTPIAIASSPNGSSSAPSVPARPSDRSAYASAASATPAPGSSESVDDGQPIAALLAKRGYAIIQNELEAKLISKTLEQQIKNKEVFGVRGFDKKFYIVSETYLNPLSERLRTALGRKEMPIKELAAAAKADENGCLAVLQVLKEQGDIIEKRKGVFKSIA